MKLGNNVRKYRFEQGELTQQELANEVNVTRLTIHSIETGKFMPSTLLAIKLAKFFGKSVEEIFYIIEDED
ncbi:helix-turn-helix transcriptional regulator [Fusibacter ferrireducens]|uniref:Helix-turn-helix transcriptional regulator n=1 Tax=Fusibacter ferrireducens TaxID=2785058 RepID=A0ABR9ZSG0_9FIRM|nr:helix-turn-helix transcriptional regulator [Fusibacter ferrireducens]MBF4693398.1 helix-turn-helix transcriptional regulator [Fusibacter ferrireducens]